MTHASGTKCDSHSDLFSSTTGLSTARRQAFAPTERSHRKSGSSSCTCNVSSSRLCLHDHIGPKSLQPLVAIPILPFESAVNRKDPETHLVQRHLAWKTLSFESAVLNAPGDTQEVFFGTSDKGLFLRHPLVPSLCPFDVFLFCSLPTEPHASAKHDINRDRNFGRIRRGRSQSAFLVFSSCSSHHLRMDSTLPICSPPSLVLVDVLPPHLGSFHEESESHHRCPHVCHSARE